MSVFKVKLNNGVQGQLDVDPNGTSIQRTIYVSGPNRKYRKLTDGETFTDCNYWKRYAYPQVPLSEAFLEVVTDDGSTYVDGEDSTYLKVYDITAAGGSTFTDNVADVYGDTASHAVFTMITNNGSGAVRVKMNGSASSIFDLPASTTQVYNAGELTVTKIEIDNSASGAADADIQIQVSIKSTCNS